MAAAMGEVAHMDESMNTLMHTHTHTMIDRWHSLADPAHYSSTLTSRSSAWCTNPHPRGQQQSKFQLKWKMALMETE